MNTRMKKYKNRNSNIEILRIISIFFIVLSHWAVHSKFRFDGGHLSLNQFIVQISSVGELGVCIFLLISGYYSVKQKQSIGGFLSLLFKVWGYNICILVISQLGGVHQAHLKDVLKYVVPIYNTHWFAYAFLILYILMPYINRLAVNLEKKDYKILLLTVFTGWSLLYTFTGADLEFSYLGWFVFVYLLGAYIRIYGINLTTKIVRWIVVLSAGALILSCLLINLAGLKLGFYPEHGTHFYSLHSPIILLLATAMFQLFRLKDHKTNVAINIIASTTFGIYLISDNPLLRDWIWNVVFSNGNLSNSNFLVLIGIGEVLLVMTSCMIIDLIYGWLMNNKFVNRVRSLFEKQIKKGISMIDGRE